MRILATTFVLLLTIASFGQKKEVEAKTTIKDVTVFLNGAQVHRNGKVNLNQGHNTIRIAGLARSVRENSIQAKLGKSNITILSVGKESNYLNDAANSPRVVEIKDSLDEVEFKISLRQSFKNVYKEEKDMLIKNKKIAGKEEGLDIESLMEMSDFYRERLKNIEEKLLDINNTLKSLSATYSRLKRQLNELRSSAGKYSSEIVIKVNSDIRQLSSLDVSYLVSNAYWVPKYDIRSSDVDGPINLTYKADVHQSTGNDWKNVMLKLSTSNPSVDNTQPELNEWVLRHYDASQEAYRPFRGHTYQWYSGTGAGEGGSGGNFGVGADSIGYFQAVPGVVANSEYKVPLIAKNKSTAVITTMSNSNVSTEFDIPVPYDINSDGLANVVEIQKYKLPVNYHFFSVPKKDNDAFLLAKISGWGDYNLMPGYMNVYFQGTYVGQSFLNTNTTKDTLNISLGRDQSIIIKREKLKDYSENSVAGGNKKATRGYEISIRNNKNADIEIEIQDQLPMSDNKEISVDLIESSGGVYNEQTGIVTWKMKLPPSTTNTLQLKYVVKYPKKWELNNL